MKTSIIYCLLVVALFGCKKESTSLKNGEKKLIDFSIEASINSGYISETITGTIDNFGITLTLPDSLDISNLIATFHFKGAAVLVNGEKQKSGRSVNNFNRLMTYTVIAKDGSKEYYPVNVVSLNQKSVVPRLYIITENGEKITSREEYTKSYLKIKGFGKYNDYEGGMGLRGRGHGSWEMSKKPYKIKLNYAASLLGLPAGRKWNLLNDYRGESAMSDGVAFKIAHLLGMPYALHAVPVEVFFNGKYEGLYTLTEHRTVGKGRIDIGKDGVLLKLDSHYDHAPWQFKSQAYDLPVTVHFPDLKKQLEPDVTDNLNEIKTDFDNFEEKIADPTFPNNDYLNFINDTSLVNFLIVHNLTGNRKINNPKSIYMYQKASGQFYMGPVWSFHKAFGYKKSKDQTFVRQKDMFKSDDDPGTVFFKRLLTDPHIQHLYKEKWRQFKTNKYQQLLQYIERYGDVLEKSGAYQRDFKEWGQGVGSAKKATQDLINWLNERVNYIDNELNKW